jgi:regulatory protein
LRITKIETQKRRPGRHNIYVDDRFFLGVSAETLLRLSLRTGDELSPHQSEAIRRAEELFSARQTALRYLSTRPRTEREIRDKLREKEFGDDEIISTINDLKSSGLINDAEFARMYVRDKTTHRPTGRVLLMRKLLLLGVSKEIADEAISEMQKSRNQEDAALQAAQQYLSKSHRTSRHGDPRKERQRLAAFLTRRGYTWDVIQPVLKKASANEPSSGEAE